MTRFPRDISSFFLFQHPEISIGTSYYLIMYQLATLDWLAEYVLVHPLYLIALAGLFYCTAQIIYLILLHPLADVPGPLLGKISNIWKAIHCWKGDYITELAILHSKYGNVVRVGFNEVSIIAPEETKLLYGHKTEFLKGSFYDNWGVVSSSLKTSY